MKLKQVLNTKMLIENYFYTVFLIINIKLKKLIFFSLKTEK